MSYYQAEGIARIDWDFPAQAARITWLSFDVKPDQYQSLMANMIDLLTSRSARKVLVDTSKIHGTLPQSIIDHYVLHVLPQLTAIGVQYMATVLPETVTGKLSTKTWQPEQKGPITTLDVATVDEAREWLRKQKSTTTESG